MIDILDKYKNRLINISGRNRSLVSKKLYKKRALDLHKLSKYNELLPSEIVDYIWLETGRKSIVNKGIIPMRLGEPDSVADISKIQKLGEWKPINWMKGIRKMISIMEEKQ